MIYLIYMVDRIHVNEMKIENQDEELILIFLKKFLEALQRI